MYLWRSSWVNRKFQCWEEITVCTLETCLVIDFPCIYWIKLCLSKGLSGVMLALTSDQPTLSLLRVACAFALNIYSLLQIGRKPCLRALFQQTNPAKLLRLHFTREINEEKICDYRVCVYLLLCSCSRKGPFQSLE